ncbi:MAG: zinc finger MYND domain-containing protein, partial [Candidatus Babeliales bacterium]|nr:zinc finger MYND domain-containing protein [Candidatus Babeliales bacterium]
LLYYEHNLKEAHELLNSYQNTPFYKLFKSVIEECRQAILKIYEEFKEDDKNLPIDKLIINKFKGCLTLKSVHEKYSYLQKLIVFPNSRYADLFFFDSIIKDQNKANYTFVCVGDAHAQRLKIILEQTGYKLLSYDFCYAANKEDCAGYFNNVQLFTDAFPKVLQEFLKSHDRAYQSTAENNKIQCNFCKLLAKDRQFKRCSGCKQVHYCSPKCQQYDWEFHKNICNYVTGKHKLALISPIELDKNNE